MPLVANFAEHKMMQKHEKLLKPWHMGTHLKVLSESYPMNTNKTGFGWFSKKFPHPCALEGLIRKLLVANLANTK